VGNGDFEEVAEGQPTGWKSELPDGGAATTAFAVAPAAHGNAAVIESRAGDREGASVGEARWVHQVPAPLAEAGFYCLQAQVKTQNVVPPPRRAGEEEVGGGARLRVVWAGAGGQPLAETLPLGGTCGWRTAKAVFWCDGGDAPIQVMLVLAGTGKVWFDKVELGRVTRPRKVRAAEKITRLVYGPGAEILQVEGRNDLRLLPEPPPTRPEPRPRPGDRERGYLTFVRPGGAGIRPEYRPLAGELTD
jgi:hypothetical protein